MDRVFLDANILFSAAYREGAGLTRLWRVDRAQLLTSDYAIEEARRNLGTPERLDRVDELLQDLERVPSVSLAPSLRDAVDLRDKDWPILGAAVACGASDLITGDHRDFGQHFGQEVLGVLVPRTRSIPGAGGEAWATTGSVTASLGPSPRPVTLLTSERAPAFSRYFPVPWADTGA